MAHIKVLRNAGIALVSLVVLGAALIPAADSSSANKPYLTVKGEGFVFNYRNADAFMLFHVVPQKPIPTDSLLEVYFEDPAGGDDILVSERVGSHIKNFGIRSPNLTEIKADQPYQVRLKLYQHGSNRFMWDHAFTIQSDISRKSMPEKSERMGPSYF